MKRLDEQELARHLLAHRRGYSITYVLRKSLVRYAILIGLLFLFVIGSFAVEDPGYQGVCFWGIGILLGAFARDVGWLRRIRGQWPFTKTVIDWKKVEGIAEEKESANQHVDGTR